MSWDVVVFNLKRKVTSVDEVDETVLIDIGTYSWFRELLSARYPTISWIEGYATIQGQDYTMETSLGDDEETFSNTIFHLYGENAVHELIELCKAKGWQAFDTSLGQMLDLDHPERNGYNEHQRFVEHIIQNRQ
jgi:hypothetical protein